MAATRALLPTTATTLLLLLVAVAAGAAAARAGPVEVEPRALAGGWFPIKNVSDPHIQELGGWAVTEHVRLANDGLRFDQVTSGEQQVVAGSNYRLILDTWDADGNVAAFAAFVYDQPWTNTRVLRSFTSAN